MRAIFEALDWGRVLDVGIHDMLALISQGRHKYDPAINSRPVFSLDECARRHLGQGLRGKSGHDSWRLRYHELDASPIHAWPAEAVRYAAADADATLRIHMAQLDACPEGDGRWPTETAQVRAALALHLMGA